MTTSLLGILSALVSAVSWGGGDFSGGFASRRSLPFQVLVATSTISMLILLASAWLIGELLPSTSSVILAVLAGIVGVLGLGALYQGLSQGSAAIVSPTAGVVGAAIPVIYSAITEGMPRMERMIGICVGVAGIWLASMTGSKDAHLRRRDLILALLAGICFAVFFILLGEIPQGSIFFPLTIAKTASIMVALSILAVQRKRVLPVAAPILLLAGVLEAGGNWGFLLARQLTRLDVAVVISSMYPAVTVILAWLITHQHIARIQWVGMSLCLLAVALIAL